MAVGQGHVIPFPTRSKSDRGSQSATTADSSGVSVKHLPRPRPAVLVFLAYLAVFYGIWMANGVKYKHIGD
jgi:hypothetical protein